MNRLDALVKANEIVMAWIADPPKNNRGFVVDGWKTPSLAERTEAVEKLADFLSQPEPVQPPVSKLEPPHKTTLYGWPTDGSAGPPTAGQYQAALAVRQRWMEYPGVLHTLDEAEAVNALINAFKDAHPTSEPPDIP